MVNHIRWRPYLSPRAMTKNMLSAQQVLTTGDPSLSTVCFLRNASTQSHAETVTFSGAKITALTSLAG